MIIRFRCAHWSKKYARSERARHETAKRIKIANALAIANQIDALRQQIATVKTALDDKLAELGPRKRRPIATRRRVPTKREPTTKRTTAKATSPEVRRRRSSPPEVPPTFAEVPPTFDGASLRRYLELADEFSYARHATAFEHCPLCLRSVCHGHQICATTTTTTDSEPRRNVRIAVHDWRDR